MLFVDYKFMVPPGGGAIIMDKSLTMDQLSVSKGDKYIVTEGNDGSVMFLKEDISYNSVRQSNLVDENQTGLDI
jgi:hypothetical protein